MSEQSNERQPKKEKSARQLLLLSIGAIAASSWCAFTFGIYGDGALPWYLISATISVAGRISDKISTSKIMKAAEEAEANDLNPNIYETDPDLPDRPTDKQLFGIKKTTMEFMALTTGIIFPPQGIIIGIANYLASIHNNKLRAEIELEIRRKIMENKFARDRRR